MSTQTDLWGAEGLDLSSRLLIWQDTSKKMAHLKALELSQRAALDREVFPQQNIGTENFELGRGYILKAVHKLNYSLSAKDDSAEVDRALGLIEQSSQDGKFIADRLVKWKPELSVTEYKQLSLRQQEMLSDCLTIKPATVELSITEPKNK